MKKLKYIYIFFIALYSHAQKNDSPPLPIDDYIVIKKGDTLTIHLNEITLLPKHKFKSNIDVRYYYWFRTKVFKAYPYAVLASERLDSLNTQISKINKKRKKKKFVRNAQKFLENEFSDQLKKMTKTEGRILIKLIYRQTGKTAFNNIKELRSGWKAFWYNTTANLFNLSLKYKYEPEIENEDYLIEDVLQRAFQDLTLEEKPSKLSFDFPAIIAQKKGEIDVEVYKKMFSKRKYNKK